MGGSAVSGGDAGGTGVRVVADGYAAAGRAGCSVLPGGDICGLLVLPCGGVSAAAGKRGAEHELLPAGGGGWGGGDVLCGDCEPDDFSGELRSGDCVPGDGSACGDGDVERWVGVADAVVYGQRAAARVDGDVAYRASAAGGDDGEELLRLAGGGPIAWTA